ncbi:MAG: NAD(P)H-hydrate dehydratase [Treponema sp.]|jgi:NAD(P)H-hydrate epimerase|nr:NAD(P)H-hydrate dehydratase [Treponema sp.]
MNRILVSSDTSRKIDKEAQDWGFNTYALIEAAGRNCARVFEKAYPCFFADRIPRILVLAGPGNNGADALCMLRYWLLEGTALAETSTVILSHEPDKTTPLGCLCVSLKKMKVAVCEWDESLLRKTDISQYDIIIDGIAGTGVKAPLKGQPKEMVESLNALVQSKATKKQKSHSSFLIPHSLLPLVVSVDLPSGLSEDWKPGMSAVKSDITLAIEPQKQCLYYPAARALAGTILPVRNIFPPELIEMQLCSPFPSPLIPIPYAELFDWESAQKLIPPLRPDIHKYHRGVVEIHAGSAGAAGAAIIAGRGVQAVGAGLIRLIIDKEIYPVVASQAAGIMVCVDESSENSARFKPDAILLGPGWGRGVSRQALFKEALKEEEAGIPLILDADAIALAKDTTFHGNALLTPHVGEFAAFSGAAVEEIENNPVHVLLKCAEEINAHILLKSHVMIIAGPDGYWSVVDGMSPNLAAGGSGDLLAGFCAALAARMRKEGGLDLQACAAVAASLLIKAGKSEELAARFIDPMELADKAADLAGLAWLYKGNEYGRV